MKIRVFHTSINLLIEPITYQRLKMCAKLKKIPMSKIIREGINLILDKIDNEINAVTKGNQL